MKLKEFKIQRFKKLSHLGWYLNKLHNEVSLAGLASQKLPISAVEVKTQIQFVLH